MIASSAESIGTGGTGAPGQMFVINLAASTSPMALSNPTSPALKRFTFFVSRQREDGRERFRLHMGYFSTQEQAEALLESVRDIYPAAWAGPAPTTGKGRRGRIAPGSVVAAAPAVAPVAAAAVPVVAVSAPTAPVAAKIASAPSAAVKVAAPAAPQDVAAKAPAAPALETMSNVRDVLAQLSEAPAAAPAATAAPPKAAAAARPAAAKPAAAPPRANPVPAPVAPAVKELTGADALSLLESPVARPALAAPVVPAAPVAAAPAPLPKAMPALPPLKNPFEGLANEPEVRVVTPEDTQTLTDIKVDKQNNAPPCFAVQLIWAVSPIDVAALPHLAIFDAYTLYNVEGNRQGRKWFGLRLGFFSDPNSATQVANYVRSDYKNVAVVPVAVKERDRAKGGAAPGPQGGEPQKTTDTEFKREAMAGFELLSDDRPAPAKRDLDDTVRIKAPVAAAAQPLAAPARAAVAAAPVAKPAGAAPKATGKPTGKRVVARRRAPPAPAPGRTVSAGVGGAEVLESTLEILGASTLSLEDGGREVITDAAARKDAKKSAGGNRFSRLLSKLGGG
jgi:hypothetical protein